MAAPSYAHPLGCDICLDDLVHHRCMLGLISNNILSSLLPSPSLYMLTIKQTWLTPPFLFVKSGLTKSCMLVNGFVFTSFFLFIMAFICCVCVCVDKYFFFLSMHTFYFLYITYIVIFLYAWIRLKLFVLTSGLNFFFLMLAFHISFLYPVFLFSFYI